MKKAFGMSFLHLVAPVAQGADIDAGKAKVAAVCAACHGSTEVSVSDSIPNLAAQLSADEMANVAAYFAAQPGPETGAKSVFLPNASNLPDNVVLIAGAATVRDP